MTKNVPHSVQSRLLNLSKATGVPYQQIVTRYFQERLLYRLSRSLHVDNFILKGGALLYAHAKESARPTLDLDFMGDNISREKESLLHAFKDIYELEDSDGVVFLTNSLKTEEIAVDKKYPGVRMSILASLGTIRQVVSMDIGFGDVMVPAPVILNYPSLLEDDADIHIKAYSIETVLAEKLQSMVDRYTTNSRMKDFYDVWLLLNCKAYDSSQLLEAVSATFANRKTDPCGIADLFAEAFVQDANMVHRWNLYVHKMKLQIPSFPELMKSIRSKIDYLIH